MHLSVPAARKGTSIKERERCIYILEKHRGLPCCSSKIAGVRIHEDNLGSGTDGNDNLTIYILRHQLRGNPTSNYHCCRPAGVIGPIGKFQPYGRAAFHLSGWPVQITRK